MYKSWKSVSYNEEKEEERNEGYVEALIYYSEEYKDWKIFTFCYFTYASHRNASHTLAVITVYLPPPCTLVLVVCRLKPNKPNFNYRVNRDSSPCLFVWDSLFTKHVAVSTRITKKRVWAAELI